MYLVVGELGSYSCAIFTEFTPHSVQVCDCEVDYLNVK